MDNITKAQRAIVSIGNGMALEALMMPSGEFRLTQTSAASAVGYTQSWLSKALTAARPKTLKALVSLGLNVMTAQEVVIVEDKDYKGTLKAKTLSLDDFDALLDYAVEQGKQEAIALNRALRRNTLIDLIRDKFHLPERTRQERVDSFLQEFARQLTRQDWLDMDREDVALIEEQLAFVGELA